MARTKTFNEEEVLDKAVTLFWEKGYNATSANDLVNRLGLSRSSLYDTYGDKRRLFILALSSYQEKVVGHMLDMIAGSENIKTTIQELFELLIQQNLDSKIPRGCLMANSAIEMASDNEDIAVLVRKNQENIELAFEKALIKGQELGQISEKHSAFALSKFLFNSITGMHVSNKYDTNKKTKTEVLNIILSLF